MQEAKEEVRARLNIEDVIGEYVQLRRVGRNFRGLSPFTDEKTPSFYVSPEKNIWHDFSSNKGGDVFSFVMEVEGMDFRASLEHLARKAGVDLTLYDNGADKGLAQLKKRVFAAYELAVSYYQQSLVKNNSAMEYVFKKRGLSKEVVRDFNIGYAPSSGDALINFLKKKGFSAKELSQAGLTNRFGGDIFRGRMVIGLQDSVGRTIGFTGRILIDDAKAPKYLNTPQTVLYDKGRHVFGLSQAKEAIRKVDYAVVVEGNMDVISSHQVGVRQVVATAGTAMTENHLRALARLTNNIKLAFDGDKAGLAATERAIPIAQKVGVDLTIISMSDGVKDPDELIKKDPKEWQSVIDQSEPAIDWLLKQYQARENLSTAMGKKRFTSLSLQIIGLLKDPVEREYYLKKSAKISGVSFEAIKTKLSSDGPKNPDKPALKKIAHHDKVELDPYSYQDNLLAAAMIDTAVQDLFRMVNLNNFVGENRQSVVEYIKNHVGEIIKDTPEELQKCDFYVKLLLLKADARYADWSDDDRYFEAARLLRQVANEKLQKQKDTLIEKLRDAETLGDDKQANALRGSLNQLIKEMQDAKKK